MPFSGMYDELREQDDYATEVKMESIPEVGASYEYKGKLYKVLRAGGGLLTKDSDAGNWNTGVEYMALEPNPGDEHLRFVRANTDFMRKFKLVVEA